MVSFYTRKKWTLIYNLYLIALISLNFISCSKENDEIYIEKSYKNIIKYSKIEIGILDLVNNHRTSIGLNSLEKMDIISTVAKSHSDYMVKTGRVSHENFSNRHIKLTANANAIAVRENVGYGYSTAKDVLKAWLTSDIHKKVIEKPAYTHFGISTLQNIKGRSFFTQIFIQR